MLVPTRPRELPDLRIELHDAWRRPSWQYAAAVDDTLAASRFPHVPPMDIVSAAGKPYQGFLASATLWWIGEEMCDLILAAKDGIDGDVRVDDLVLPDDGGLLFFARPLTGLIDSASGEHTLRVDAICWGRGSVGPTPVISIASYHWLDLDTGVARSVLGTMGPFIAEAAREAGSDHGVGVLTGKLWVPLGRSEWPLSDPIGASPPTLRQDSAIVTAIQEDRRILAAFAALVASPGVADVEDERPDRAAARRDQRLRRSKEPADVRVVRVHRPESRPTGGHREVQWDHRWMVSGHWSHRWVGKRGHQQRRLTWVRPHSKGPADAPLVVKETVRVLDR